ncbi:LysR family transcriptional regulator [Xanthobacter sp. TB0139]|uniref:LysR family transcriptional regulator n=1 Tax=Xanthobacter sp. TB0139 TaxID=3459178 RepID=UPI004038FD8E
MIDKLEYLIALSRERHFGRAAESCGISQPTLSAGIKHLEDVLGVLLVQRGSRFVGFTPEGERALDWARRIVGDTRAMRQDIEALKRGLSGPVRIAAIPSAMPMVAALTSAFCTRYPDVRFTIISGNSEEILTDLENLAIDAGLTYLDNEPLGRVNTVPLYQESYRLIARTSLLPEAPESISWKDVASLPLALMTSDMQNRRIIDGALSALGQRAAPMLESNSMIALLSHVRSGLWASVMPAMLAEALGILEGVRAIPIMEPELSHSIGLVAPYREPSSPITTALIAEARRIAPTLQDGIWPERPLAASQ